tara:strand:- start:3440 stop:4210 length:771 start_codon:yes stop_codon:yes gene_type:complete
LKETALPIINSVSGIGLEQLASVDFDGRIDTKYIFHANKLAQFLNRIKDHVVILNLGGNAIFDYKNVYFDTANFEFFRQHHAGYLNRIKIRAREYSEQGPFVFEIKTKSNKGLTIKDRVSLPSFDNIESELTDQFLKERLGYGFDQLPMKSDVNYQRMTFANKEMTEKFTLDLNLTGSVNNEEHRFENLVIAEVKQERFSYNSVFVTALKELKIHPHSFSKYCATVMHYQGQLKRNRFKPIVTKLEKIRLENGIAA